MFLISWLVITRGFSRSFSVFFSSRSTASPAMRASPWLSECTSSSP